MDLTDAYENGAYIPGAEALREAWPGRASDFRGRVGGRLDLAYGPKERNRYDLFAPEGAALGLLVFIHGGYWKATSKDVWSHLAAGPLARGWAVAMPSYTLAPEARIGEITQEIAQAVTAAAQGFAGPLVITGHSAGGHLAARMRSKGVLPAEVAAKVRRCVPISPLSDLRPLMQTEMNAELQIDAGEAQEESPALLSNLHQIDTRVWVGGAERPAFLDQSRWLGDAWGCDVHIAEGKHHFDVIDTMETPDGALTEALVGGLA